VNGLLALVPARGGSKGLPRKNAKTLGDLPLLGWTAEAIRASGVQFGASVLSTDDAELAELGRAVGLDVPFLRPAELANDTASALAVVEHALGWFAERGREFDAVAWLQPTSPFRPPSSLGEAISMLARENVPAVIGVKDLHRSPSVLFHADRDQRLVPLSDGEAQSRRQDVPALVTPNGALYVVKTNAIRASHTLFPPGSIGISMDQISSLDIDDAMDWAIAEAVVAAGLTWRSR
jgi:CMP-N,N'-diacetyllegionaminic acid synthase